MKNFRVLTCYAAMTSNIYHELKEQIFDQGRQFSNMALCVTEFKKWLAIAGAIRPIARSRIQKYQNCSQASSSVPQLDQKTNLGIWAARQPYGLVSPCRPQPQSQFRTTASNCGNPPPSSAGQI